MSPLIVVIAMIVFIIIMINLIKMAKRQENGRRISEQRSRWGNVVNTHTGTCPHCSDKTIITVYETGNMETNCTGCNYRATK